MFVVILELRRKLGESKADQERRLQERLKRRQELIQQREEKGLNWDEAILDAIQDQEEEVKLKEERKKRKVCQFVHKIRNQHLDMWPSTKNQEDSWILGNRKVLRQ